MSLLTSWDQSHEYRAQVRFVAAFALTPINIIVLLGPKPTLPSFMCSCVTGGGGGGENGKKNLIWEKKRTGSCFDLTYLYLIRMLRIEDGCREIRV